MWQKIKSALPSLVDAVSDLTGYAAVRVPLEQASGANEVTLDLPGYGRSTPTVVAWWRGSWS